MADDALSLRWSFPGIVSIIRGAASIGHGEMPGVFMIDMLPQESPPALIGPLSMSFAGETYTFEDCRAVSASYSRNSSGQIIALTIEDWRWRWRFGVISGVYNRRQAESPLDTEAPWVIRYTEKTPRELIKLCFEQMGQPESDCDTTDVPDNVRPLVEWDVTPAAQALAALCDLLGCRIVPMPGNKVKICPLGEGAELPEHPSRLDSNQTLDPPEKPSTLAVIGGPVEFQYDFELEAVGEDKYGNFVPIDKLTYKPAGGWAGTDPKSGFGSIPDERHRRLAEGSVYRCYQIKIPEGGLDLPGYTDESGKKIKRREQLVVLGRQIYSDRLEGFQVFTRAYIYGAFEGEANIGEKVGDNTLDKVIPLRGWDQEMIKTCVLGESGDYDQDRCVLRLGRPLIWIPEADDGDVKQGTQQPAKLRYRVAVNVLDEDTSAPVRYVRKREYGPPPGSTAPTKAEVIRREEIVLRTYPKFGRDTFTVEEIARETHFLDPEADYYLDQREAQWQNSMPSEASYAWIIPLVLDGAIQHVVYQGGVDQPPTTRISRNNEMKKYIVSYKERRRIGWSAAEVAAQAAKVKDKPKG